MATISIGSSLDSKGFNELNDKLDKAAAKVQSTSSKITKATKIGLAALSGMASGAAAFAIDATLKLEDANVQLENSFKNAGTSIEAHKKELDKVQQQMEKFGYSGDQTRAALARMTTVTGSADKALRSIGLAADIAKNRHLELEKAGDLLSKTMAGSTAAAKRMGIAIPDSILKIQDPAQKANAIMGLLEDRFNGSAAAAAGTLGGKFEKLKAQMKDLASQIGERLVPTVQRIINLFERAVNWTKQHKEASKALAVVIGTVLVAAVMGYVAAMTAAAIANIMATWEILLIVLAIAALVAALVYCYNRFKGFRDFVKSVWGAIRIYIEVNVTIIRALFAAISWTITKVLSPVFKGLWHTVQSVFNAIVSVILGAWNAISTVFGWISGAINGLIGAFQMIVGGVSAAFTTIADTIEAPFKAAFNGIAWLWNNTVGKLHWNVPGWLQPIVGFKSVSVPQIPEAKALGGSVMGNTPYIVGEKGPELFVPGASGSIVPNHRLGGTVVQNITITSNDPQQVVNALIRYQQRNGSIPIRTAA